MKNNLLNRPVVLSIAGFDPSAGAGILADIKTLEAHHVYGLGVTTAITYQNDIAFTAVDWLPLTKITAQLDVLFQRFSIAVVKIGLIADFTCLQQVIAYLKLKNSTIQIIWDPILKASAGYEFHKTLPMDELKTLAATVFLVTPNWMEMEILTPSKPAQEGAQELSNYCNVLLKGGHAVTDENSTDLLYMAGTTHSLSNKRMDGVSKHGSGCVLSAAIAANLASGYGLADACSKAKQYINHFLKSNTTLLGYHN